MSGTGAGVGPTREPVTRSPQGAGTAREVAERDPDVRPTWSETGLPLCDEECPNFDGKRCKAMGFRPDRFCEPELLQQAEELARYRGGDVEAAHLAATVDRLRGALERIEAYSVDWAEGMATNVNAIQAIATAALAASPAAATSAPPLDVCDRCGADFDGARVRGKPLFCADCTGATSTPPATPDVTHPTKGTP